MLRGIIFVLVLLLPWMANAASRGLSVEIRSKNKIDAPITAKLQLYSSSYALVIGNDAYDSGWPRLSNAVKDAEMVAVVLREHGFEVTLKKNLNSRELEETLRRFFVIQGEARNSRLFVWYAGHGYSENGEGYLIPIDAPAPSAGVAFRLSVLPLRRFGEYMRMAQSKHALAVFDSCFAGTVFANQRSMPPVAITLATTAPVRQFLTSGDAGQTVSDDGRFRRLFLNALRGIEPADANDDGYLTASELGLFLTGRMINLTKGRQTPRYGKLRDDRYDRGDFIFSLRKPMVIPAPNVAKTDYEPAQKDPQKTAREDGGKTAKKAALKPENRTPSKTTAPATTLLTDAAKATVKAVPAAPAPHPPSEQSLPTAQSGDAAKSQEAKPVITEVAKKPEKLAALAPPTPTPSLTPNAAPQTVPALVTPAPKELIRDTAVQKGPQNPAPEVAKKPDATAETKPKTTAKSEIDAETKLFQRELWKTISDDRDPDIFRAFLAEYPDSLYAPLARAKLRILAVTEKKRMAAVSKLQNPAPVAIDLSWTGGKWFGEDGDNCDNFVETYWKVTGRMISGELYRGISSRRHYGFKINMSYDGTFYIMLRGSPALTMTGRFDSTEKRLRAKIGKCVINFEKDD